jgi:tRNA(fMet)-specific endonuclease VapC
MILLDTNVCIGFMKGHRAIIEALGKHAPDEVRLCSVVKAELYFGARASQHIARNLATLERFCQPYLSLPFDDACARIYGQLRADLKRTGQIIGANDLMIAATALAHNLTLVTHNVQEFSRVPGLLLEDWEEA